MDSSEWHTIFDLFNDFYSELEKRGYSIVSKVENSMIDDIVHGGPKKRHQNPKFSVKNKEGLEITIGCDYNKRFYFRLYTKENKSLDKIKIKELLQSYPIDVSDYDKDWVFTRYFDVPENYKVNIWDFNQNGTFRIIKPDTRKETIKRYLDDMENFLYNEMNILQFAK